MLYESKNSLSAVLWKVEENSNFSFPKHLHDSFEFLTVTDGEMIVEVDGTEYTVKKGEAVMIFPNQVHSLTTPKNSSHFLCIFSKKLVQGYSGVYKQNIPTSNIFSPHTDILKSIFSLKPYGENPLKLKGALYTLCADFDKSAEYREKISDGDGLLEKIFGFVEKEYASGCSLEALSEYTSYHYVYLSRYFKKCTGLSFTEYVIKYRVNEAIYLLNNSTRSILQIAFDCGFDSLRSFNRNFKRITGRTPTAYRSLNS